jgi:hypothetical protein
MATSGTSSFNMNRNEIIRAAARKIQAVRRGASMGAEMVSDFNQALNAMVKHWQGQGLHVWTVSEATLFPQVGQVQYALSNAASSDHATQSYVQTAISAAEASGQTVISLDATTNITAADHIGITLDDGTLHWSTVSSKTTTTATIALALTDSAAADNLVYTYTNKIVRPLRIVDARSYDPESFEETHVGVIARKDYQMLSNKVSDGTINQIFYDPQLTTGQLHLYQTSTTVGNLLKFTWWRPIEDFSAAGDNPDLPQEWIQTLIFNLAVVMAPEFDVPSEKLQQIASMAGTFKDDMMGWDREAESFQFSPGFDGDE